MKEIIKWLQGIEHLAYEVYRQAALIYIDDPDFHKFLEDLAEDEAWHSHVMGSAADFLASKPDFIPAILVDKKISDKIMTVLSEMKDGLEKKTLAKDELIEKIVTIELSEWNDIFLYAVNVLKERSSEFKYPAARIQSHIKGIEYYLETVENRSETLRKIAELPPVWVEKILIVDDESAIANLIKAILNRSGNIDVAHNGREALKLIEANFYKLIITDIKMPVMDGIEFFNQAVAKFPTLKNRFLFMSGNLSPEQDAFFTENRVKYLLKPMNIIELRDEAVKIILSQ